MIDHQFKQESFRFPGEEVSWAGECPWTRGFCFATESGKLLVPLPDVSGAMEHHDLIRDGDPINDIAFADDLIGVSTRSEVAIFGRDSQTGEVGQIGEVFEGGALGLAATSAGGFVAPRGPYGLLFLDVVKRANSPWSVHEGSAAQYTLNFSKLIRLGQGEDRDIFGCAARGDGFLAMTLSRSGDHISALAHNYLGLDAVDVCSLGNPDWPFAVAGVGADRTVILSRDIREYHPQIFSLEELEGKAYSVLSAGGHLVLLTSKSLFVMPQVVTRFLSGQPLERHRNVWELPFQAVDIYSAYDRWLLVELSDQAVSIDLSQFAFHPRSSLAAPELPTPINGQPISARNREDVGITTTHDHDWNTPTTLEFALSTVP